MMLIGNNYFDRNLRNGQSRNVKSDFEYRKWNWLFRFIFLNTQRFSWKVNNVHATFLTNHNLAILDGWKIWGEWQSDGEEEKGRKKPKNIPPPPRFVTRLRSSTRPMWRPHLLRAESRVWKHKSSPANRLWGYWSFRKSLLDFCFAWGFRCLEVQEMRGTTAWRTWYFPNEKYSVTYSNNFNSDYCPVQYVTSRNHLPILDFLSWDTTKF